MEKLFDFINECVAAPDVRLRAEKSKWKGIITHHTTVPAAYWKMTPEQRKQVHKNTVGWLTKKDDVYVSAHFQIAGDGTITQMVDPSTHVAFHAGVSAYYDPIERKWVPGWNERSIGVELLGDGNIEDFTDAQYAAHIKLSNALLAKFTTIDPRCCTGHENIAPARKTDPGKYFNWRRYFAGLVWTF